MTKNLLCLKEYGLVHIYTHIYTYVPHFIIEPSVNESFTQLQNSPHERSSDEIILLVTLDLLCALT